MFKKLKIDQFVIIDKLELDFKPALTILTGETGAGKSILLDATGLVLGDPSAPDSIRSGSEQSVIEAVFSPPENHPVWQFLIENSLAQSGQKEFHIYREIRKSGGDDIRLNGKPIDLELLKKIGTFMVEIHGQFANQSLLDPANQLSLLDLSGGFPPEIFSNVATALHDVHRLTKELEEENTFQARHKKELPKIEKVVGEMDRAGMREGFVLFAKEEYARLLTAKETSEAFQAILAQLISGNGVVGNLATANNTLVKNKNMDPEKMKTLAELLKNSLDNAREAVMEMGRLAPEYDIDTKPLYQYRDILTLFEKIAREAKITYNDLEAYYFDQAAKLNRIKSARETIARLQDSLIKAKDYLHHAHILHEKRTEAAKVLSSSNTSELPPLKLIKAEFKVDVTENANMTWTEKGIDEVVFTARMNPGQPFSPVAETASGGEMARLILALKVVVQRVQTIPTLIFDEVDTGIGGAAAAAVGERLALLADTTQVLVITHSPQVASRGDTHLHVSKQTDGITTKSIVKRLEHNERLDEISRMLAGDQLTTESHAAAQSLINEATRAADSRRQKLRTA